MRRKTRGEEKMRVTTRTREVTGRSEAVRVRGARLGDSMVRAQAATARRCWQRWVERRREGQRSAQPDDQVGTGILIRFFRFDRFRQARGRSHVRWSRGVPVDLGARGCGVVRVGSVGRVLLVLGGLMVHQLEHARGRPRRPTRKEKRPTTTVTVTVML